jgi:hypothetical protein
VGRSAVIAVFVIAQLTAQAALGVQTAQAATVAMKDGVLYYRAAPGEQNSVIAGLNDRPSLHVRLLDSPNADAGEGCTRVTEGGGDGSFPYTVVKCAVAAGSVPRLNIELGDGLDSFVWTSGGPPGNGVHFVTTPVGGVVSGGPGNDGLITNGRLYGGPGDDSLTGWGSLYGGPGDDELRPGYGRSLERIYDNMYRGGAGDDRLVGPARAYGGPGSDTLFEAAGPDVIIPGPGEDRVRLPEIPHKPRGRDVVLARDGHFDSVECGADGQFDRVSLDGVDWMVGCPLDSLHRSAAPRAVPLSVSADPTLRQDNGLFVLLGCPKDATRACAGAALASVAGRLRGRSGFRLPPGHTQTLTVGAMPFCSVRRLDRASVDVRTAAAGGQIAVRRTITLKRQPRIEPVARLALPDGKRLALTHEELTPGDEFVVSVVRRYAGCKLDTTFGLAGTTKVPFNRGPFGSSIGMVRVGDGRIVLGGVHEYSTHHFNCCAGNFGIAALTPDGNIDRSFGEQGFGDVKLPEQDGGAYPTPRAFYLEQAGGAPPRLALDGTLIDPPARVTRPAFARFSLDGELLEAGVGPPGPWIP